MSFGRLLLAVGGIIVILWLVGFAMLAVVDDSPTPGPVRTGTETVTSQP